MPEFKIEMVVTERTRCTIEVEAVDLDAALDFVKEYSFDNSELHQEESLEWSIDGVQECSE